MPRSPLAALIACAAVCVPLVACGDDDSSARAATSTDGTTTAAGTAAGSTDGSAAALARSAARASGILGPPTGTVPASRPRAVVLILHGGGWAATTDDTLKAANQGTEGYRSGGFATYAVRMKAGRGAIDSATAAYDAMRRRYGARTPICAIGASTGGHVGLMLAIARPNLACVVSNAGPTDLPAWAQQVPAAEGQIDGYFGGEQRRFSPAERPRDLRARVLLQYASNDRDVPLAQGRAFRDARPRGTQLVVLRPGTAFFAHSEVDARQLAQVYPRQERLLRSVARAAGR
ncbi:S9 family peptidase [Patulibacter sp.]|uniref:alpha/beta hydrolase family protein n=1 Tax=Patulibacter sp. TaxID=1912859 RepID=UPI00271BD6D2|nr:prolyl oligopeptidase family serine peptidase [Patulibacter sp.]MDO9407793.1 prolyl oligopeptidase family serine peptidase [Patulibacter sp.]